MGATNRTIDLVVKLKTTGVLADLQKMSEGINRYRQAIEQGITKIPQIKGTPFRDF